MKKITRVLSDTRVPGYLPGTRVTGIETGTRVPGYPFRALVKVTHIVHWLTTRGVSKTSNYYFWNNYVKKWTFSGKEFWTNLTLGLSVCEIAHYTFKLSPHYLVKPRKRKVNGKLSLGYSQMQLDKHDTGLIFSPIVNFLLWVRILNVACVKSISSLRTIHFEWRSVGLTSISCRVLHFTRYSGDVFHSWLTSFWSLIKLSMQKFLRIFMYQLLSNSVDFYWVV